MIVLDTSFIVAFYNRTDVHHDSAKQIMERLLSDEWGTPLLPEYVFLELTTVIAARRDLKTAVEAGQRLLDSQDVRFMPCSELFFDAFEIFSKQSAKTSLSFVDSALIAAARRYKADCIATFDRDFTKIRGIRTVP